MLTGPAIDALLATAPRSPEVDPMGRIRLAVDRTPADQRGRAEFTDPATGTLWTLDVSYSLLLTIPDLVKAALVTARTDPGAGTAALLTPAHLPLLHQAACELLAGEARTRGVGELELARRLTGAVLPEVAAALVAASNAATWPSESLPMTADMLPGRPAGADRGKLTFTQDGTAFKVEMDDSMPKPGQAPEPPCVPGVRFVAHRHRHKV